MFPVLQKLKSSHFHFALSLTHSPISLSFSIYPPSICLSLSMNTSKSYIWSASEFAVFLILHIDVLNFKISLDTFSKCVRIDKNIKLKSPAIRKGFLRLLGEAPTIFWGVWFHLKLKPKPNCIRRFDVLVDKPILLCQLQDFLLDRFLLRKI